MTKTNWTSADYWEASKRLAMGDILLPVSQVRSMLDFAAERIEAEGWSVPDDAAERLARYIYEQEAHERCKTLDESVSYQSNWLRAIPEARKMLEVALTPPASTAAQVDKCCCGEPSVSGVRHRLDGPCYLSDGDGTPAQEHPGWKVPEGWEVDVGNKSIAIRCKDGRKAVLRSDIGLTYNDRVVFDYFTAASPAPPKEK